MGSDKENPQQGPHMVSRIYRVTFPIGRSTFRVHLAGTEQNLANWIHDIRILENTGESDETFFDEIRTLVEKNQLVLADVLDISPEADYIDADSAEPLAQAIIALSRASSPSAAFLALKEIIGSASPAELDNLLRSKELAHVQAASHSILDEMDTDRDARASELRTLVGDPLGLLLFTPLD